MERPSPELRLPTMVSIAIAVVACGVGYFLWSAGTREMDGGASGHQGYVWLLMLLFAGAAFLVASLALYFAESRLVFWIGLIAMFLIMAR